MYYGHGDCARVQEVENWKARWSLTDAVWIARETRLDIAEIAGKEMTSVVVKERTPVPVVGKARTIAVALAGEARTIAVEKAGEARKVVKRKTRTVAAGILGK